MSPTTLALLLGLVAVSWLLHRLAMRGETKREAKARTELEAVAALGEIVPPSLHPKIDPDQCMGSGSCVRACPEKNVIGLVGGRVKLLNPLACVGHGACAAACPVDAIDLVFGTEKRGVELPRVDENFQTSAPGVYIIGELGGMGLIRNAMRQGRQAADHVVSVGRSAPGALDAVVVGAGPAGIAATLRLMEAGKQVLLLEQGDLGGTILHYPRGKVVMTGPLDIPLYGRVKKKTMSKEDLLLLWQDIVAKTGLQPQTGKKVTSLTRDGEVWVVRSEDGSEVRAASVLLALGRRGSPRKLGVPGEQSSKVTYRLLEPRVFAGKNVLVVGGGNSAVESALLLAKDGDCASVTISYRRTTFARCRGDNRTAIEAAIADGTVQALLPSEVKEIGPDTVTLDVAGEERTIRNDAVIVQIGGTAPADLLRSFGIQMLTKYAEG